MTSIQKAQLEFLNETVEFYTNNKRCVDDKGGCRYYLEDFAGCAIGRHISDIELRKELDSLTSSGVSNNYVFNKLPDALQELGQSFLQYIQMLHDDWNAWNKKEPGLSILGKEQVQEIKEQFGLI